MAADFHITEGRWSARRLRAFVAEWLPRSPVPITSVLPWARGAKGPSTWFFGEGSIRGCSLQLDADLLKARSVDVRLNLMASRADWQIGQALVRDLLAAGGGQATGPDDAPLGPDALNEPAASGEALLHLRQDAAELAASLENDRTYAALPNPEFSLIVTNELLPEESDPTNFALALEEELALMAARYKAADVVNLLTLPDGSSFTMWPGGDALAFESLFFAVALRGDSDEEAPVVLPGARLFELLGDRIEVVSEDQDRFFLPTLEYANADDASVLAAIAKEGQPLESFLTQYPEF